MNENVKIDYETAEKVMDVQDVSSTLTRQILDNLYHSNNPGHAVWELGMGDDTLDDLMTTRIGRIARCAASWSGRRGGRL